MYRTKEDFLQDWTNASNGTLDVLRAVTDEALGQEIVPGHNSLGWIGWHVTTALGQEIVPGHNSLGWIGWHVTTALGYFTNLLGFRLSALKSLKQPTDASAIADQYARYANEMKQVVEQLTDDDLLEEVDVHGATQPRGAVLRMMMDHQTHHRGQMTVLLRQAGLPVPGVMGPTKEQMQA